MVGVRDIYARGFCPKLIDHPGRKSTLEFVQCGIDNLATRADCEYLGLERESHKVQNVQYILVIP